MSEKDPRLVAAEEKQSAAYEALGKAQAEVRAVRCTITTEKLAEAGVAPGDRFVKVEQRPYMRQKVDVSHWRVTSEGRESGWGESRWMVTCYRLNKDGSRHGRALSMSMSPADIAALKESTATKAWLATLKEDTDTTTND